MEEKVPMEAAELASIIEHIFEKPIEHTGGKCFLTTMDVYRKVFSLHPSDRFSPETICEALMYMEIEIINGAGANVFWYLKER